MLIAALLLLVFACLAGALLWSLALHALPLWIGGAVALALNGSGAALPVSLVAGLGAAAATLVIGQLLIGFARSPLLRVLVGLAFALPAAIAGYHAANGIATALDVAGPTGFILSLVAAATTGIAAWSGALRSRRRTPPGFAVQDAGIGSVDAVRSMPLSDSKVRHSRLPNRRTGRHGRSNIADAAD